MKGSRIAVVRIVLENLIKAEKQCGSTTKLAVIEEQLRNLSRPETKHILYIKYGKISFQ
jgi:hypothetical protein